MGVVDIPNLCVPWFYLSDKLLHFIAFFSISVIAYFTLLRTPSLSRQSACFLALAICVASSVSNEVLQMASPERDALSVSDMAADAAGYISGSSIMVFSLWLKSQRQKIPLN